MFWGLSVHCGCNMNWAAASQVAYAISLPYYKVNLWKLLSLQLVCNQGNHSVVNTTNLFLQSYFSSAYLRYYSIVKTNSLVLQW